MKKIAIFLILATAAVLIFYYFSHNNDFKTTEITACPVSVKTVTVNGLSMYPFFESGEEVKALYDYYDCKDVLRNDVVLYKYSGNNNLLIKFIKAVPGDKWGLKKTNNGYEIVVNDITLLNSEAKPYLMSESSVKMLELYIKDYPVIPADAYLLLGDKTDGSLDSTSFGLVGKKDIMAKVEVTK
ncbi:MAG: signal peptidase I [Candidatus Paceibacterota bacterium]|jgi:signal peptidase I